MATIFPEPGQAPFGINTEELATVCNFDLRLDPAQRELLNTEYGGVSGVAKLLKSNIETGISLLNYDANGVTKRGADARDTTCKDQEMRREMLGENIIPPPKSETIFQLIVGTVMEDPILKVLIVGAIIVMILGTITCPSTGWSEGLAIVIAVFLVLGVTAGNDYSKDLKFKKLMLLQTDKKCRVIRSGHKFEISSWDILVGDLIELVVGDEVPSDGIFVRGNGLVIDESPLTGETIPVKKNNNAPYIFSGCQGEVILINSM